MATSTTDELAERRLATARAEFDAEVVHLDSATLGLPPRRTVQALERTLDEWRRGVTDAAAFDAVVEASRRDYARLVGVEPAHVAVGSQVSAFVGLVAASLPPGSEVLTATDDFTSVLFPLLAQQARGVTVREAPLERLAEAVTASTGLVAVSAVQSADGRLTDLDDLVAACDAVGARTLVDTTQAAGWLPVDAGRFTYTTGGGYKWLLAPRGTAFFTIGPDHVDQLLPVAASWYAGEDRWSSIYGGPLRLATDARRFDVSPAWQSWVGQAASLELLLEVGTQALHHHACAQAARFCAAVGLPFAGSAIVSARADGAVPGLLADAGIRAATRAGRLRLAFHVSTSAADTDLAAAVLDGHLAP
ncbi:aminotransferase class V-fold PLP-dependent enzyme [Egicoccus halophilus]|uniref:Aminotransferase class V n=1 Tax=Egicoccus halophilus TaxID=1670830 RepID=A0A8J3AGP1_9ACTN|nr:aminotransferase class V-fold PLP-dependent enzyme [Egicoccus halophilus]GGI08576.1 aminotransferase class V [Egicoccus halophilus]